MQSLHQSSNNLSSLFSWYILGLEGLLQLCGYKIALAVIVVRGLGTYNLAYLITDIFPLKSPSSVSTLYKYIPVLRLSR